MSERVRWWAGVRGVIWKQKEKVRKTTNENILDTCNMWQVEIVVDEKLLIKTNTHTHTHTYKMALNVTCPSFRTPIPTPNKKLYKIP